MGKLIALFLLLSGKTIIAYSQNLSDCLAHGFISWCSNHVSYLANKKTDLNTSGQKDEFIERYKKFGYASLEMNADRDSAFSCLNYSIHREFIVINKDSSIKSVILHFPFSQNLYDQILRDYQKTKAKIVKWGLDIFSENSLNDYTIYLEQYRVLVYIGMDNEQNQFLGDWLSSANKN